ncbi:hypothetical protein CCR78_14155 [Rhodovulum imhoffii]|nr:hypothetical protein [Rhodovulum imhoffii]
MRQFLYPLVFAGVGLAFLFVRLLPVGSLVGGFPGPDVMLCLAFAWVQRRPDYLPPLLLVAVFLTLDLMLLRPPGLWTALVLLGAEFLRSRRQLSAEMPFGVEWALVGVVLVMITLLEALILSLTAVHHPGIGQALMQTVSTLAAYPVIVFVSKFGLGVRRPTPDEANRRRPPR